MENRKRFLANARELHGGHYPFQMRKQRGVALVFPEIEIGQNTRRTCGD
jgi:hypothetical protein